jgi:hypothetical protein
MALVLDDPRDILEHLITPGFMEEILPALHGKNNLNINLRKRTCHRLPAAMKLCHPFGIEQNVSFNS